MFCEMRRYKQQLSEAECKQILDKSTSGVLCLMGDNGYTYGVPLSFVYEEDKLYFHSAKSGHKIDAINEHENVSFTIVYEDNVLPERTSTCYKSLILFGRAYFTDSDDEKRKALLLLSKKYSPKRCLEELENIIKRKLNNTEVIVFDIRYMTGKEAIEHTLMRKKHDGK